MTTLTLVAHKYAGNLPASRQPLNAPFEFRALHKFSVGQICPKVKRIDVNASSVTTRVQ